MSDTESVSSIDSDDSSVNFIPGRVELPVYHQETEGGAETQEVHESLDVGGPYEDDPIASEEFTEEYKRQRAIDEELKNKLQLRVDGKEPTGNW